MTCPSPLARSMYADGALSGDEAAALERHAAACPACGAELEALVDERRVLTAALRHEDSPVRVPAFRPAGRGLRPLWSAALAALLAAGPLSIWATIANIDLPAALAWLNPFSVDRAASLASRSALFLMDEGVSMMTTTVEAIAAAVVTGALLWGLAAAFRARGTNTALLAVALAAVVLPSLGQALEIRRSEGVLTIPAGETIDDTLIALGENIEIDGNVTGDLIALGRRVNIRGAVQGQVVAAAQSVTVQGDIGAGVIGFAENLSFARAAIAGNVYGFGREVITNEDAEIGGNAVVFASDSRLAGPVGVDILGFASELALSGRVDGDVTAYASRVTVLGQAVVGGDLVAHVMNDESLQVSPSATIGGEARTEVREREGPGPGAEPGFGGGYAWQIVRFGAAFLTGLLVLGIASSLRRATPGTNGIEVLTSAGVGLVAMVATPIIALLVAITLIGIPIALLMFLIWSLALYFSKILFSHYLGRMLFARAGREPHFTLSLLVGLLIVLTVTSVPLIGGVLNFLLTITGLGMLVIFTWARFQGRRFGQRDLETEARYP